jgi:hypothetical protein
MTTERRGLFVLKTSEDGTKCAAECPRWRHCNGESLRPSHAFVRTDECVQAQTALTDVVIKSMHDGFEIARELVSIAPPYDGLADPEWDDADQALDAEIERIRGGR